MPGCRHAGRLRGKAAGWRMQMTRVVLVSGGRRLLGQRAVVRGQAQDVDRGAKEQRPSPGCHHRLPPVALFNARAFLFISNSHSR